ncbi:NADH-quinone oxidoreductase subunit NuoN [Coralloluteibacterium thermophilus]|uniref:NADH-quinone oxidoreductase subunit N n=1 Tax=Coralloluteibacterium thermophilum TaxID=2707049 RepID=A0ABV9NII7_9GAMM
MTTTPVMPTVADLVPVVPELFLVTATFALLVADLFVPQHRRALTHYLAIAILAVTGWLAVGVGAEPGIAFGGMVVRDLAGDVMKAVICGVGILSFLYAKPYLVDRKLFKGEFHLLVLLSILGMLLLVSSGNLVMVYLGLELMALSTYALVAMDRDSARASEAAMKYFVLGALASGMLLYGMSMIYGATGSLDLAQIYSVAAAGGDQRLLLFGVVFVLTGVAFKFGAAPFHMWIPDVYHGAPTAITVFIGSAPKLAAFGMAYRLLESGAGPVAVYWQDAVAWLAVLSLVIGNLLALAQANLKRMLAYSTVSHVGFLFLGLAAATPEGYASAMFYAISYAVMATASFGAIVLLSRQGFEAERIDDFKGLNQRSSWHAWMVMLVMASLAGVPPLLGFWAKLAVLRAAVGADMLWLAIVGIVFAVVGAYYYLRVIKVMFFDAPVHGLDVLPHPDRPLRAVFTVNAFGLLVLGIFWSPLMAWCQRAFAGS